MAKASDNPYPSVLMAEQGSTPATPATGKWRLFTKSDGLYLVDDAGAVTGPFAASTGPAIAARYSTNAGQSIPNNTETVVNFEDVTYDTNSAVTVGAAWVFTAPSTGYYHVSAFIDFAATTTWADGERAQLFLYKNNTKLCNIGFAGGLGAANQYQGVLGVTDVYLAAGDTIDIRAYQTSGGALALLNDGLANHVSIHKI